MENRCVICRDIIPEGREVCPMCQSMGSHGFIWNHYSRKWTIAPHFTEDQVLEFKSGQKGIVRIVDECGTFFQNDEPSYDIEFTIDGKPIWFKHIRQSIVEKALKDKTIIFG